MNKLIRDGQVAVLYSPRHGGGWYSWNPQNPEILFDPAIVELVEQGKQEELQVYVTLKYPGVSQYGLDELKIAWLPQGTAFRVNEYDGSESIEIRDRVEWLEA